MKAKPEEGEELRRLKATVGDLRQRLSTIEKHNDSAAEVRASIFKIGQLQADPPAWTVKSAKARSSGVPVTIWSDWHLSEVVTEASTAGANEFNSAIGQTRVRRLVEILVDLTKKHMTRPDYPGIVVCLGGDMISGDIHEELAETNDMTSQQAILLVEELLIWAFTELLKEFPKIFVPCVVGNHGRDTKRVRFKGKIHHSLEWAAYMRLARHFKGDRRIQFLIPDDGDAHFSVYGHRFLLTHGDCLGVKGGDGIIGALGPIARGAIKVGRSEAQIGRDFDTLLMGHWHTFIPPSEALSVVVNGTLKGYDEFARLALRVPFSRPSQALFFVHPKHGITACWPMYLEPPLRSREGAPMIQWR